MKITLLAFFLLFAFSIKPLLALPQKVKPIINYPAHADPVLDSSGKAIRTGINYYAIPANGGGLTLASIGDTCPMDVVAVQGFSGLPLSFTPINSKKGVVRVSTDLNIMFSTTTDCPQANVWKLDDYDYEIGVTLYVRAGGEIGNPGFDTIGNWFQIQKYEDAYKFVYCPSVNNYYTVLCQDIGISVDSDGNKRLAASDSPFKVRFQRA